MQVSGIWQYEEFTDFKKHTRTPPYLVTWLHIGENLQEKKVPKSGKAHKFGTF